MFLCSVNLCIIKPPCMNFVAKHYHESQLFQDWWRLADTVVQSTRLGLSLPHRDCPIFPLLLLLLSLSPSQINPPKVCGCRYHVTLGTQLLGALKTSKVLVIPHPFWKKNRLTYKYIFNSDVSSIYSQEFLASSLHSAHASTEWRSAGWYRAPEIGAKFQLLLGFIYNVYAFLRLIF